MIKVVDKMLLFLYSIVIIIISLTAAAVGFGWIPKDLTERWLGFVYQEQAIQITVIAVSLTIFLISVRFLFVSFYRGSASAQSIDQRTDFGDIRISMETIENLALKAASRNRSIKDLRARIKVTDAGLEIAIRTVIDGETSIPQLTEEVQGAVKSHVEEITGMPVANVAVFVANVISANTFKSRVE